MDTGHAQDPMGHAGTTPSAQPLPITADNQNEDRRPTTTAGTTERTEGGETKQYEYKITPTGSTAEADTAKGDAATTAAKSRGGAEKPRYITKNGLSPSANQDNQEEEKNNTNTEKPNQDPMANNHAKNNKQSGEGCRTAGTSQPGT